jgi:hypothetical protein
MPKCGQPSLLNCSCPSALQTKECCKEDKGQEKFSKCKCNYLKEACTISIKNERADFCIDAEFECCKGEGDSNCKCAVYKQICFEFPSKPTSEVAAASCCEHMDDYGILETCYCDFYTFTKNDLDYESEHRSSNCSIAGEELMLDFRSYLEALYDDTGGESWYNNTGWLDEVIHYC